MSSFATYPQARYGGRHTVALLTGDGIGPEMLGYVKEIFRFSGCPVDFEEITLDRDATEDQMRQAMLAVQRNGVAMKGNIETKEGKMSKNVYLRTNLGLYAFVQRCKSIPGVETRHSNVDFVIIRENTEGEYSSLEHENVPGVVESLKIITEENSTRIARFAFEYARKHGRRAVTAVHKANIMKLGDGLFLECCRSVSQDYPDVSFNAMIVDNCAMQLVSRPQQFDVMVMPNLYGNVVGNIGAALVGGAGVVAGANIGDRFSVFETGTRNSGRSLAGKNIANPTAMLLTSANLLEHIGLVGHAQTIRLAVLRVIGERQIRTPDLGGQNTTLDVVQAVVDELS